MTVELIVIIVWHIFSHVSAVDVLVVFDATTVLVEVSSGAYHVMDLAVSGSQILMDIAMLTPAGGVTVLVVNGQSSIFLVIFIYNFHYNSTLSSNY